MLDLSKYRKYNSGYTLEKRLQFVDVLSTSILIFAFSVGIALGSYITSKIIASRAKRLLHIRGESLREIANYKWDTGEQNDAVVICRMALKGLEHE